MSSFTPTARTSVRRLPKRGVYDRAEVYKILDEAVICHVGFNDEAGRPVVIPTGYGRKDGRLYLHGSSASRMLRGVSTGIPVCVTVTLLDGMVLARSAFHHSMNYRSVVIFGEAAAVTGDEEKNEALRLISDHLVPGRWDEVRLPSAQELKATSVLFIDLNEVSAKVRTGGPADDEEDMQLPVWAGVIPLQLTPGKLVTDPNTQVHVDPPTYATNYRRPHVAGRES
jgi:nitroimidazol reductase NimA-like FMN-containing flavoprotein (pyridoxamine 5'-phosphate oxidase superfamily)